MGQEVVVEAADVEEDALIIKEEFGEEGEVLREELVFFAVDLEYGVVGMVVDHLAGRVDGSVLA